MKDTILRSKILNIASNHYYERLQDVNSNERIELGGKQKWKRIRIELHRSRLQNYAEKLLRRERFFLKNEDAALPLLESDHVAVFGRCQKEYYRSGTGSGGAVNVLYTTNLLDGLRDNGICLNEELVDYYEKWILAHPYDNGGGGWASEPWCQQEMPVSKELVAKTAAISNKAVVVIGRTAGEDKDNAATEGSYYLTETEHEILDNVCGSFAHVIVVLNVGNIIDMNFVQNNTNISSVVYAWQGGMEGGNGIADVLTGKEVFQGKLTDTIAKKIMDYPSDKNHGGKEKNVYQEDIYVGYRYFETFAKEAVLYPFGYGLSYTEFSIVDSAVKVNGNDVKTSFSFTCRVKNIGTVYSGREIVQLYVEKPVSGMGRPVRELVGLPRREIWVVRRRKNYKLKFRYTSWLLLMTVVSADIDMLMCLRLVHIIFMQALMCAMQ